MIYRWFPLHLERRAYRAGYRRILPHQLPRTDFEFIAMYYYARWTGVILMGLTR